MPFQTLSNVTSRCTRESLNLKTKNKVARAKRETKKKK
jgi:hypothetical protein